MQGGKCERTLGRVIVGYRPVAVERDADLTALLRLEFFAVEFRGVRVRENDMVSDTSRDKGCVTAKAPRYASEHIHPRFPRGITLGRAMAVT